MTRQARSQVFEADQVGVYHVFNRTCRRAYLHGVDPLTGVDHSHRRLMFRNRMQFLARYFCIDVLAYAILSNHWHCVLRNRPDLVQQLSDREVAKRWAQLTSRKCCRNRLGGDVTEAEITEILSTPGRVAELRVRLSDVSWFVRLMCQTVARECNREDGCTGRFFEERFKLNRLADEEAILACMAYVDLNPLRAGMSDSLRASDVQVSIGERLRGLSDEPSDTSTWLAPLKLEQAASVLQEVSDTTVPDAAASNPPERAERRSALTTKLGCLPITLVQYAKLLQHLALESRPELQASHDSHATQVTTRIGSPSKEKLLASIERIELRCDASLGEHACRVIRKLQQERRRIRNPPTSLLSARAMRMSKQKRR